MVILLIVFSAGSFFAGTKYQQSKITSQFSQRAGLNNSTQGLEKGTGTARNNTANTAVKNQGQTSGFKQTVGEIISLDDTSITVKMTDGSSKIILISSSTIISQSVEATNSDLKVGANIAVNGDQNTDGSVTGKTIEINPHIATITPSAQQ